MVVRAAAAIAAMPPISTRSSASGQSLRDPHDRLGRVDLCKRRQQRAQRLQRGDAVLAVDHRHRSRLALEAGSADAEAFLRLLVDAFALREALKRARVAAIDLEGLGQADVVDALDEERSRGPQPRINVCFTFSRSVVKSMLAPLGNASTPTRSAAGELIEEARRGNAGPPAAADADALEVEDDQDEAAPDGRLVGRKRKLASGQRRRRSRRVLLDELRRHDTPRRSVDGEDEVLRRQVGNRLAAIGDDGRVDRDELGGRAEGGL